jgi:L-ascorbate metabolism protein UlaG (beta-lactamase superfamily)
MRKLFLFCLLVRCSLGQDAPRLDSPVIATNRDVTLRVSGAKLPLALERSTNALTWAPIATLSTNTPLYSDSGAGYRSAAFYRAHQLESANVLTGDNLATENGTVTFHPVNHASFVMSWNGLMIYNDPVLGAGPYASFPRADLILVSHDHSDHYDSTTLKAVRKTNGTTIVIAPRAVYNLLSADLKAITTVLANGAGTNVLGIQIDAVPAYNSYHEKLKGNGYVLTIGGKRVYMTGDTGALEEMKSLPEIDVAFVCMNIPFTMTSSQAATIVREFAPHVVYPYHYRNQDGTYTDLNLFRQQLGTDRAIEVRARKWY